MKVVVSAQEPSLDAASSPVFGRCPAFVFVDTETWEAEGLANPSVTAGGGAGIQAAQWVMSHGAEAVLSSNVGPNAFAVFQQAGIPVYRLDGGTVREAVEALRGKLLAAMDNPQIGPRPGRGHGG